MTEEQKKKIGRKLSLVLRHNPQTIGIQLDNQGWTDVTLLLEKFGKKFGRLNLAQLQEIVEINPKKRYAFSEDGKRIRASQGHSVEVELGYELQSPPEFLYHGTATKNLDSIKKDGLQKRNRHHVHLSPDEETALNVGRRHGKPIILPIKSGEMHKAGTSFFRSENGVWLTDSIPSEFIDFENAK
jgi:putative RNA 2'-phosphotransferase